MYSNASVDFDTTDVGNVVLGIKDSGADAVYLRDAGVDATSPCSRGFSRTA